MERGRPLLAERSRVTRFVFLKLQVAEKVSGTRFRQRFNDRASTVCKSILEGCGSVKLLLRRGKEVFLDERKVRMDGSIVTSFLPWAP